MDPESLLDKIDKIWKDLETLEEDILSSNLPRKSILARHTKKALWTLEDLENSIKEVDDEKRFVPPSGKFRDISPKLQTGLASVRSTDEPPEPKPRQISDSEFFRSDGENMWMKVGPQRISGKDLAPEYRQPEEESYELVSVKRVERDVKNVDLQKRQFRFDSAKASLAAKGPRETFGYQTTVKKNDGRVYVAVDCKRTDREVKTDMTNDRRYNWIYILAGRLDFLDCKSFIFIS